LASIIRDQLLNSARRRLALHQNWPLHFHVLHIEGLQTTMMRGRRLQRIDRALSHVLNTIDDKHEQLRAECNTWRDLDILSADMDKLRIAAFDKARRLELKWEAIVKSAS
jgi:hypothetical protein